MNVMGNTMKASDLHRIVTVAKAFSSTDATLPMLGAVRLEATESTITAAATDRFVLGVSRSDYTGEAFVATLDRTHVDTLAKMAKTVNRDTNWREAEITVGENTLEFRFTTGESLSVRVSDHEFPKFRQLIPSATELETENVTPDKLAGFDASKLAQFTKVPGHDRMSMWIRGCKPTVVRIGDDFIGLITPVRIAEDCRTYQRPAWITV